MESTSDKLFCLVIHNYVCPHISELYFHFPPVNSRLHNLFNLSVSNRQKPILFESMHLHYFYDRFDIFSSAIVSVKSM